MHHMGVPLDGHIFFHLHTAYGADLSDIVAAQIHQHIVLRPLLLICQQLPLQRQILGLIPAPGSGARQREGIQLSVLQLHQRLGTGPGDLPVLPGKIEHIGGGIHGTQNPVRIKQAAFHFRLQPVGQYHLKDIPFFDIVLSLFHHGTVLSLVKQGRKVAQQLQGRNGLLFLPLHQCLHIFQLHHRPVIAGLGIICLHIGDQHDLLAVIVKGNDLVKEHQVHILKAVLILRIQLQRRFAVLDIIIGEISHKPSGKAGQSLQPGALILPENLPDIPAGIILDLLRHHGCADRHLVVAAADRHDRIIPQKGIPPPLFIRLRTLQQIRMFTDYLQLPQHLDGGGAVGKNLRAHRDHPVASFLHDLSYLIQSGSDLHKTPPSFG